MLSPLHPDIPTPEIFSMQWSEPSLKFPGSLQPLPVLLPMLAASDKTWLAVRSQVCVVQLAEGSVSSLT